MFQTDGTLSLTELFLLCIEATFVKLVIALIDNDLFWHLRVADNRTHALVTNRVGFDKSAARVPGIRGKSLSWLDHVARTLYIQIIISDNR